MQSTATLLGLTPQSLRRPHGLDSDEAMRTLEAVARVGFCVISRGSLLLYNSRFDCHLLHSNQCFQGWSSACESSAPTCASLPHHR
jgi:hypothetical protein